MEIRNIDTGNFIAGLLCIAYSIFVKVSGTHILDEDSLSLFTRMESNPFVYYLHLIGSGSIGILLLYRSLLFIPANKTFQKNQPVYFKRRIAYFRQQSEVNLDKLATIVMVILLIFITITIILAMM